jgi:cyclin-dependent kinase 7
MEKYRKVTKVGSGTYGTVYRYIEIATGRPVALKRIHVNNEDGIHFSAVREITTLRELHHPHIVGLRDVFYHKQNCYLVFDYALTDLNVVLRDPTIHISPSHIKAYMYMILSGTAHLHDNLILHRDLKPGNLLVMPETGFLALADFGLAKLLASPQRRMSPQAVTRWYRPPELFFGADHYGPSVDMWSIGCIFFELWTRAPLFPGENDLEQLARIFAVLGTPREEEWPEMIYLPAYVAFEPRPRVSIKHYMAAASPAAIHLLERMLTFNPNSRISAREALQHPYFRQEPAMAPFSELPLPADARALLLELQRECGERLVDTPSNDAAAGLSHMSVDTPGLGVSGRKRLVMDDEGTNAL